MTAQRPHGGAKRRGGRASASSSRPARRGPSFASGLRGVPRAAGIPGSFPRARRPFGALIIAGLALAALPLAAEEPVFSGVVDSKASGILLTDALSDGDARIAWSLEESANLRFKASAGEKGTVYGAFNLRAWAADAPDTAVAYAPLAGIDPETLRTELSVAGETERLYVSLRGEAADLDAGLMRVAFGYAPAFRPTDILNPPNPLYPSARPRGVLGLAATAYPTDDSKLRGFFVSRSPTAFGASGVSGGASGSVATGSSGANGSVRPLAGFSGDLNARRFSLQPLYLLRLPESAGDVPDQYAGLSLKLEAGAGLCLDALWTNEDRDASPAESVKASVSADWSAFDAKLYLLGQYLWNGPEDRGVNGIAEVTGRQYGFATVAWQWDDYTRFSVSGLANLEDGSLAPALSVAHEPFQGMGVTVTARAYLDASGDTGELSPSSTGTEASVEVAASLRF